MDPRTKSCSMRTSLPALALAAGLALTSTGCVKKMLLNGTIGGTRQASDVLGSIGDYELARGAASAGLVQLEGYHKLAPDNEDALFMLARGWVSYGFAFAEDDFDVASASGDKDLAAYHKKRAKMAYDR